MHCQSRQWRDKLLEWSYDVKTVHSPLFFRKIIEIESFALRAAILHECQNYLGGGGGLGGSEKNNYKIIFLAPAPQL